AAHAAGIGRLAGVQAPREPARGSVGDAKHVPIGALERRREFIDRRLHGGGDHGVDLGGMRRARGHDQYRRGRDRACAHDIVSYHAGSSPFALWIAAADGAVSALISAFAASASLALVVTPAE